MAWSTDFVAALEGGEPLVFLVSRLAVSSEPGATWSAATHPGLADDLIVEHSVQVAGARLNPRGWTCSFGGFSLALLDVTTLHAAVTRGTILALYATTERLGYGGLSRIAVGALSNVRGHPGEYVVECVDLQAAFRSRLVRTGAGLLFGGLASTTLTAGAPVAVAALPVTSTTGFARETGGLGGVLVETSSGDAYYRRWSAKTATTLTVDTPADASVGGTTDIGAASADAVREVAYMTGHPIDVARRVICSTGAGTNGDYDTYPTGWSLGVLDSLVDHDDCDHWRDEIVTTGGPYAWQVWQADEAEDGWAWLQGLLSLGGLVLTMRQGSVTVRAAQEVHGGTPYPSTVVISDDDVAEVAYEAYDSQHDVEYEQVRVVTFGGDDESASRSTTTLPKSTVLEYDLSALSYSANQADIRAEMLARLTESATRIPERLVLTCAGLRLAQLAVLDVVRLASTTITGRGLAAEGYDYRPMVVDQVDVDWTGGSVTVGLLVYPATDEVFA